MSKRAILFIITFLVVIPIILMIPNSILVVFPLGLIIGVSITVIKILVRIVEIIKNKEN